MKHRTRVAAATLAAALLAAGLSGCSGAEPQATPAPRTTTAATDATAPSAVPAADPAPAPRQVGKPTRVLIPEIGVDEALHGVGLKADGAMQTPDFGDAGWYDLGPRPGARGPAVIVAHVHGPAGDDVFADLADLEPGDRVTVRRTDGSSTFVVDKVARTRKEALPVKQIWSPTDAAVLRLITCGGTPDPVTRMYPENTIVFAHAVS